MRVLFAILILALAGLLWASFAAAHHIRRARSRRRGLADATSIAPGERPNAPATPNAETKRLVRSKQFSVSL